MKRQREVSGETASVHRPRILQRFLPTYMSRFSRYPDRLRVSFDDGTTAIYLLKARRTGSVLFRKEVWK